MATPSYTNDEEIGRALREWYQGDCTVSQQGFFYQVRTDHPLVPSDAPIASGGTVTLEDEVAGLMVLTQTCDIIKDYTEHPYIEVCPLVEEDELFLHEVKRGRRPNYAFVPRLEEQRLVADLERVMTMDKGVVARWHRVPGCITDDDRYRLAQALGRKRSRFAFPDDFNDFIKALRARVLSKHDKDTDEGKVLRDLHEIRVRAEPSWEAPEVRLEFLFILAGEQLSHEERDLAKYLEVWRNLIPPDGRFVEVRSSLRDLEVMPSSEYVKSIPLDLDHLSSRKP